jgi:hypothetical protein
MVLVQSHWKATEEVNFFYGFFIMSDTGTFTCLQNYDYSISIAQIHMWIRSNAFYIKYYAYLITYLAWTILSLQQLWYYFLNCVYLNPPCQLSLWEETGVPGENPRLSTERKNRRFLGSPIDWAKACWENCLPLSEKLNEKCSYYRYHWHCYPRQRTKYTMYVFLNQEGEIFLTLAHLPYGFNQGFI